MSKLVAYALALIVGIMVVLVPIINGRNAQAIGSLQTAFMHYLSAFITGMLITLMLSRTAEFANVPSQPIAHFAGGAIGVGVILLMNIYSVRLKAFYVSMLPLLGQITMGVFIDYHLTGVIESKTFIGLACVIVGMALQSKRR